MSIRHIFVVLLALTLWAPLASRPVSAQGAGDQVAALIAEYPQGGQALTDAIASLIAAQPDLASTVIADASTASPAVVSALSAGLAQGAVLLATTDPGAVQTIRAAVTASGNPSFSAQYGVAYTVALSENPAAQAALLAANPSGGNSFQTAGTTPLVSPN